jgi:type III pantothenate kinase
MGMLLAIDIGNTNTVLGIFDGERLIESWRLVSSHTRTADEYWITVKLLCNDAGIRTRELSAVAISSVVPDLTSNFEGMSEKYLQLKPLVVHHRLNLGLALKVAEPVALGADRICNAVAGKAHHELPQVIVDLGTATTFDVLDSAGDYIGGAIAPGLITGGGELIRKAAQLHRIELKYPEHIIGQNTEEHLQSGIFIGHLALIEGLLERMMKELGLESIFVVATGGLSEEIARYSKLINTADTTLTLEGLRLIYTRNQG